MSENTPAIPAGPGRLPSERVIIQAPLSFTGSAGRIWRITEERAPGWQHAGWITLAVLAITLAWAGVLCWYAIFGLLLVPYRLLWRGQRKRDVAAKRHAELLAAARSIGK